MLENPGFASKNDNELVKLTLENQDNFLHIVNRYEQKLLKFIIRISGVSFDEAQDILQEVFIKIYKNLNDFDPDLKFSSWVYRITRNHVIDHHRKNKNRPQPLPFELNEEAFDNLASEFDINQHVDRQLLKQKVAKSLNKINPRYKEVIVLK